MQLHQRIGARLEAGYGARAGEIAAQLALHFERGGEVQRAVHYWQQAAGNAARRNAHHEAITALTQRPGAAGDPAGEPRAHPARTHAAAHPGGAVAWPRRGVGAPDVGDVYTRAHPLPQQVGETPQLLRVLQSLSQWHMTQGQLAPADALAQQLPDLVQRQPDTGSRGSRDSLSWGRWRAIVGTS